MSLFHAAQRAALLDGMLPAWTQLASCAEKAPNRAPWGDAFADEMAYSPDPAAYDWPPAVLRAMKLCAGCPVRPECLDYAYESEARQQKAYWASETTTKEDRRRWGVYGGTPGRIREHFPDPPTAETWFMDFAASRGWSLDTAGRMTA